MYGAYCFLVDPFQEPSKRFSVLLETPCFCRLALITCRPSYSFSGGVDVLSGCGGDVVVWFVLSAILGSL